MASQWTTLGAASGALAVALSAFGAHGLKSRGVSADQLSIWSTASNYHLIHSLVLAVTPLLVGKPGVSKSPIRAAQLFAFGTVVFSGSLYLLVLTGEKRLGAITPIGGTALIAGWIALALRK